MHQHLSQRFFDAALSFLREDYRSFDQTHLVPAATQAMLAEARGILLDSADPADLLAALGFHLGLEFFAHEEFNLVDVHLRTHFPALVAALERGDGEDNDYLWLAIHTVVEIHHYRAGLEAVKAATRFCCLPEAHTLVPARVKAGFNASVDLQQRYYEAILAD